MMIEAFWAEALAYHLVVMTKPAPDVPAAVMEYSPKIIVCGLEVPLLFGPEGTRGLSPQSWQRLYDHFLARAADPTDVSLEGGDAVLVMSLGIFRPLSSEAAL